MQGFRKLLTAGVACSALVLSCGTASAGPNDFYVSVFGGANWLDDTAFSIAGPVSVSNDYDTGFLVGGALGYDFGQIMAPFGVRVEGELSYRENDIDTHSIGGGAPIGGSAAFGDTSALAGMVNVLIDLDTGTPFNLFAGGGVGVANVDFDGHGVTGPGVVMSDDDTVFAWQLIAGVGYDISASWALDVQYRYFRADDVSLTSTGAVAGASSSPDYESHAVMAALRWSF